MSKRKPFIFITQDKLIDLCRYDTGWFDTVGGSETDAYPESGFDIQCENEYPMLLSDLKTALTHFEEENTSFKDFTYDWWCPITSYFYEDLCLDELLGPDPDLIADFPYPPIPENDEDMITTIMVKIAAIADKIDEKGRFPNGSASKVLGIPDLLTLIENFEDNKDLPPEERTYTREQMLAFLNHWDNSLLLVDAPENIITRFVSFTNRLCDEHVFEALKIKAFAHNGGNAAFPCDYEEAARLFTILLKEFGFGYAANALGFIHYDGKLTGKPDFDKAFAYFAIASNYNISEAKLMFADMLLLGQAGNPDPFLAYNIFLQVYHDARIRFESGEYTTCLPESAMRIAHALSIFPEQKGKKLKLLLEASYSAFVRYQTNKLHTDLELSKQLQTEIDRTINDFGPQDRIKINSAWQTLGSEDITDFFDDFTTPPYPAYYTLKVRKLKNKYRFTIERHSIFPGVNAPLSLSVQPWLLRTGLCSRIDFSLPVESVSAKIGILSKAPGFITFDKLLVRNDSEKGHSIFTFFRGGEIFTEFTADRIFFNKPVGTELK